MLSAYGFFRIHNSHLINMHFIKSYHRGKGGSVLLTDGSELEVSTRRKDEFLKRIAEM
jgi:two-component system LytT family response regulator